MAKAITEIAIGVGLIALDIFAPEIGIPASMASLMGTAGAGLVLAGVGTLLTPQGPGGLGENVRNPVQPWNVIYGRAKVGGTLVFVETTGSSDSYLHMVFVLACHPCLSVDALLLDGKRVQLDGNGNSNTPHQISDGIASINRTNDVVTVTLKAGIPLMSGDQVAITNVSDASFNGTFIVNVLSNQQFTYVCGGAGNTVTGSGTATTTFPNYGSSVHMETLLGNHTSTFPGLLQSGDQGSGGAWTTAHMLSGRTAVYVRLKYDQNIYSGGLPNIAFLVHGKTGINDPRSAASVVLQRPSVLLNGWGPNAHIGAYESGVDQGNNFPCLDGSTTQPYANPGNACDGDPTTSATCVLQHTHTYAGCVWSFGAGTTPVATFLNILSEVPTNGENGWSVNTRSAGIYYSLDGGNSWARIYDQSNYPPNWASVELPANQDQSKVQVMAFTDSHDDMCHVIWDIQIATGTAASAGGYTENAALCIADYLSNTTYGFKAAYGTDIPNAQLIAAANVCDELVPLATGGTEPRYTCNGTFPISVRRGEVLQNLLTSCGGRLTYTGGQFVIWPAAWVEPQLLIQDAPQPVQSGLARRFTGANCNLCFGGPNSLYAQGDWSAGFFVYLPSDATGGLLSVGSLDPLIPPGEAPPYILSVSGTGPNFNLVYSHLACTGTETLAGLGTTETIEWPGALPGGEWIYIGVSRNNTTKQVTAYVGSAGSIAAAGTYSYSHTPGCATGPSSSTQTVSIGSPVFVGTVSNSALVPNDLLIQQVYLWNSCLSQSDQTSAMNGSVPATSNLLLNVAVGVDPATSTTATTGTITGAPLAGGQYTPVIVEGGAYLPQVGTLSNAAGPFRWSSAVSSRDLYNGVKGTYINPANSWQSSDFPRYAQDQDHGYSNGPSQYFYDANLAADGGERRWEDIQLPFTISAAMAQRLAKIQLMRRRQFGTGTFLMNLALYQTTALDVVEFTLPILGWSSKLLEVVSHRFTLNKDQNNNTMLGCELDLKETAPSVYEWNTSEELSPQGYGQPLNTGVVSGVDTSVPIENLTSTGNPGQILTIGPGDTVIAANWTVNGTPIV